ncbi:MAG: GLPGLI family protein [Flavobacteriaceae bacterium]|nr:GLPGLI family protein [Flavobacteriaceae bacterium]
MKRKELLLLSLCIFIITSCFSQRNKALAKAKISYGISIKVDRTKKSTKLLSEVIPNFASKVEAAAAEFDFTLLLNDSISLFFLEKKLYSNKNAAGFAESLCGYFGRVQQQATLYITENLEEDFGKFLVSRPYQKWELQNETKQIGDYTCFKATTFTTTTNPKGKVFRHDFTAWYSPQLPYKFGPAGYGNLPGLIVELQGKNFTYGIKKIEFFNSNESKKRKIPKLKKLKQISEEELEKLAAEDEKRWQNRP